MLLINVYTKKLMKKVKNTNFTPISLILFSHKKFAQLSYIISFLLSQEMFFLLSQEMFFFSAKNSI